MSIKAARKLSHEEATPNDMEELQRQVDYATLARVHFDGFGLRLVPRLGLGRH
jgi:hypothetical protein